METDRYVAGVIVADGRVVDAAPILRWSTGRPVEELIRRIEEEGGKVTALSSG